MRKTRLYLDTSVISDIDASGNPERGAVTKEFFQIVTEKSDEFELIISPITIAEIEDTPEPKLSMLTEFLKSLSPTLLPENREAENLAWVYVLEDVLSANHIDDLMHVGYAVTARCDYIISWNRRHLVNVRTISRVNNVNKLSNFSQIFIATPSLITGEINHEND